MTWLRTMSPRSTTEEHRVATPLELFFDLCFVVAVVQASGRMHHALSEDHVSTALAGYAMVFFAIWWAWMNFTWFASAYDVDDIPYRLCVFVQISGVLILAAGIPRAFDDRDFAVAVVGYLVMRCGLVVQWLRAAASDAQGRRTAQKYALGVAACQVGWVLLLALPEDTQAWGWLVLVPAELAVPAWSERFRGTAWHPHHIAERYGLFTIIVLGESVSAATLAVQSALDSPGITVDASLYAAAGGGLLIVFAMWWLYFAKPAHRFLTSNRSAFLWGYGHYFVFGSAAAVGAGIAVNVDHISHVAHISGTGAGASVTIPVAVYLMTLWVLHLRPHHIGLARTALFPGTAALVLLGTYTGQPVLVAGLLVATLVAVSACVKDPVTADG